MRADTRSISESCQSFVKSERGSHASPFQQNPISFTPFRNKPERVHHPGKLQNHLTSVSANQVPLHNYLVTTT
jgi:hypothetical protein